MHNDFIDIIRGKLFSEIEFGGNFHFHPDMDSNKQVTEQVTSDLGPSTLIHV